uniref:GIT Spa2 homology (SHD) domain-containing protein n=1 Tax=Romanomermis culicivorax TaxID=13658 RepID=A0A915IB25_ROMCU
MEFFIFPRSSKAGCFCTPIQTALVQTLYNAGSNNVWEHFLLDPSTSGRFRRKPTIGDPLYPSKADFIKSKYVDQAFVLKPNFSRLSEGEDGTMGGISAVSLIEAFREINKQLYSCVRTNYVETTLRLLAQGANPMGYVDPDTGFTPMHIAAREGQDLQVELLYLYGADPMQPDFGGLTPYEHAKQAGHFDLASHLFDLQYEVTDRMSFYLCSKKPDHSSMMLDHQHFIVPELSSLHALSGQSIAISDSSTSNIVRLKPLRRRIQGLNDASFEKLAQDVYDELDRREVESEWSVCLSDDAFLTGDRYVAPFLPVNSDLPSIRNQYRQKLAKFTDREFCTLIVDVLAEAKRRCCACPSNQASFDIGGKLTKSMSSSATASSFVHGCRAPNESLHSTASSGGLFSENHNSDFQKSGIRRKSDSPVYDVVASDSEDVTNGRNRATLLNKSDEKAKKTPVKKESTNFNLPKQAEATVTLEDYLDLRAQLAATEAMVEEMQRKNEQDVSMGHKYYSVTNISDIQSTKNQLNRKFSDIESEQSQYRLIGEAFTINNPLSEAKPKNHSVLRSASLNIVDSMFEHAQNGNIMAKETQKAENSNGYDNAELCVFTESAVKSIVERNTVSTVPAASLPYPQNLIALTESLTNLMQRLFADARTGRTETFAAHADAARSVVDRMLLCVPPDHKTTRIDSTLSTMADASIALTVRCAEATTWLLRHESARQADQEREQAIYRVIQAAYDVAKAAKTLINYVG